MNRVTRNTIEVGTVAQWNSISRVHHFQDLEAIVHALPDGGMYDPLWNGIAPDRLVRNLTIEAAPGETPIINGSSSKAVRLWGMGPITLRGLRLWRCRDDGVQLLGLSADRPMRGVTLEDLDIDCGYDLNTANRDGIKPVHCRDVAIRRCNVRHWGLGGAAIDAYASDHVDIEGCTLVPDRDQDHAIMAKGGCRCLWIAGNTIGRCGRTGVWAGGQGAGSAYHAAGVQVIANTFTDCAHAVKSLSCDGLLLRNNSFTGGELYAEVSLPGQPPSRDVRIEL